MIRHFTITLSGNLHQKGYKLRAMMLASQFRIKGSVTELDDTIIIEAEGTEANLVLFFEALKKFACEPGSENLVEKSESKTLSYFEDFIIK